jgi:hypothetical protein
MLVVLDELCAETQPLEEGAFWVCTCCTLHNHDFNRNTCEACDSMRPGAGAGTIVSSDEDYRRSWQYLNNEGDDEDEAEGPSSGGSGDTSQSSRTKAPFTGNQWVCSACTYENPSRSLLECEICGNARPPDSSYSERLIAPPTEQDTREMDHAELERLLSGTGSINEDVSRSGRTLSSSSSSSYRDRDMQSMNDETNSHLSNIMAGAVFGGIMGGVHAFFTDRPVGSGALQGASVGAASFGVINALAGSDSSGGFRPYSDIGSGESESASAGNLSRSLSSSSYSSSSFSSSSASSSSSSIASNPAPTSSSSSTTWTTGDGRVRVVYRSGSSLGGGGNGTSGGQTERDQRDPFNAQFQGRDDFTQMLRFVLGHVAGDADVDNMDYDELLQRFGSGHATRAADDRTIHTLPTHEVLVVNEDTDQNSNKDTCNICLCDYEVGESCKTLPCNHVYHSQCIDRWLRNVSKCPICKASVI